MKTLFIFVSLFSLLSLSACVGDVEVDASSAPSAELCAGTDEGCDLPVVGAGMDEDCHGKTPGTPCGDGKVCGAVFPICEAVDGGAS